MRKTTVITSIICIFLLLAIIFFSVFFNVRHINIRFENDFTVADKNEILSLIEIDSYSNIFAINEHNIEKSVEEHFPDKSVDVTSVIRSFPNIVTIVVRERTPFFLIPSQTDDQYVVTDKDFTRYNLYGKEKIVSDNLIKVNGLKISNSIAVPECEVLKRIAGTLIEDGFSENALPYFVSRIDFSAEKIIITLFDDATFTLKVDPSVELSKQYSNITTQLRKSYQAYLKVPYGQRVSKNF